MKGTIQPQLIAARNAKLALAKVDAETKKDLLTGIANALRKHVDEIIQENSKDLSRMDPKDSKYDRLLLTADRIEGLANSVLEVAELEDPTGKLISAKALENGLYIEKRRLH